ncbi:energy transducer TonB [Rivularia sp. UHCC 0363]|uniref:energy transducer TonB n=1 Tax=Rivularia sp. UHCC 0363 TaxID=3110244 RepID=UPI002B211E17|nr:energy transducer TonB [Rivularia sp. UHCC 0363]MEA5598155.1 energy transducer TonB [Rivularia sp. UHCC 0363]
MSFSSTALQQRERELKALRLFLACSLIGSLIFHVALLASGIGRYLLNKVPEIDSEPVEITLLDAPPEEIEPKQEVKPKPKPEPKKIEPKLEPKLPIVDTNKVKPDLDSIPSQSQISGGSRATSKSEPIPTQRRVREQAPPVVRQQLPSSETAPFKPFKEPLSPVLPSDPPVAVREKPVIPPQPKPEPKPEKTEPIAKNNNQLSIPQSKLEAEPRTPREFSTDTTPPIEPPKPTQEADEDLKRLLAQERNSRRTPREFSTPSNPPVQAPQPTQQDSGNLRDTLSGIRESQENTKISSNNTAPFSPNTSNNSNSDIGESSNSSPRRKRRTFGGSNVATAPTSPSSGGNGLGSGTGEEVGDGDGRAACRKCDKVYPVWAKRRGIEGQITVTVDTDAQGNVTNVRLLSSSGNSRLDKEHLKLARNWKLKPSSNGRQGVRIVTKYELQ